MTGDPTVLQKVIWDLCQQAIEAVGQGGRIALQLTRKGDEAHLSIAGGEGHAYDLTRLDVSGLQALLESQNGRFTVQNDERGATFRLALPLRTITDMRSGESGATPPAVDRRRNRLQGVPVLAVDDSDDARDAMTTVLSDAGASLRCMESGHELLAWLRDTPPGQWPKAIVCDTALGDEDGYTVMRQVRRTRGGIGRPLAAAHPGDCDIRIRSDPRPHPRDDGRLSTASGQAGEGGRTGRRGPWTGFWRRRTRMSEPPKNEPWIPLAARPVMGGSVLADRQAAIQAVEMLMPMFASALHDDTVGRSGCMHVVIMDPALTPADASFDEAILYEFSLPDPAGMGCRLRRLRTRQRGASFVADRHEQPARPDVAAASFALWQYDTVGAASLACA